ncbi:17000_t:CDS:2, partial [Dentiscutata erythropus]
HIARHCLSERDLRRHPEERQATNYVGWFNHYNSDDEGWAENEKQPLGEKSPNPTQITKEEEEGLIHKKFDEMHIAEIQTCLEWLKALAGLEQPPQETSEVVEVYQLGSIDDSMNWDDDNDEMEWEDYYEFSDEEIEAPVQPYDPYRDAEAWWNKEEYSDWDKKLTNKERGYQELVQDLYDKSRGIEAPFTHPDEYEILSEEKFLLATSGDHRTGGWYKKDKYEIFIIVPIDEMEINEAEALNLDNPHHERPNPENLTKGESSNAEYTPRPNPPAFFDLYDEEAWPGTTGLWYKLIIQDILLEPKLGYNIPNTDEKNDDPSKAKPSEDYAITKTNSSSIFSRKVKMEDILVA